MLFRIQVVTLNTLSWEQAGASPIVSFLSYILINEIAQLTSTDTIVIHSASGGVGSTAIQVAKLAGAKTIIGTVGSIDKVETVLKAGADYAYTYDTFANKVIDLTNGLGVNIVLDSVAGYVTNESIRALANFGKLVQFGNSSGKVASILTSDLHKSCRSILGFSFGTTRKEKTEYVQQMAAKVLPLLNDGVVYTHIDRQFPLTDVAEAYEYFRSRKHKGKILLSV